MPYVNLPNDEPFWLDEKIVKAMHDDQAQHGGIQGIRDENERAHIADQAF